MGIRKHGRLELLREEKVFAWACAYNAISPDSKQKQQHKSPPAGKPKHLAGVAC